MNTNTIANGKIKDVDFDITIEQHNGNSAIYVLKVTRDNGESWGMSFARLNDVARFCYACGRALDLYPNEDLYNAALCIYTGNESKLLA